MPWEDFLLPSSQALRRSILAGVTPFLFLPASSSLTVFSNPNESRFVLSRSSVSLYLWPRSVSCHLHAQRLGWACSSSAFWYSFPIHWSPALHRSISGRKKELPLQVAS